MNILHFDALKLVSMASGHLCLELSEKVEWEDFPNFASIILKKINGRVIKKCESVDIKLWTVLIDGVELYLVWDDYPFMTTFEALDDAGDALLKMLFETFKEAT